MSFELRLLGLLQHSAREGAHVRIRQRSKVVACRARHDRASAAKALVDLSLAQKRPHRIVSHKTRSSLDPPHPARAGNHHGSRMIQVRSPRPTDSFFALPFLVHLIGAHRIVGKNVNEYPLFTL